MKSCIIIPAHNEATFINEVILSYINQTVKPSKVIIVDDNSTDSTYRIAKECAKNFSWLEIIRIESSKNHLPGEKIVTAFNFGLNNIDMDDFDFIGKFDADILLPNNYFENISTVFLKQDKVGIAGGNLYIKEGENWIFENISSKKKVRGPIKLYRKECFNDIGGLKKSIGWDTVDELLAQYHGWQVCTDESLHVKHLKPTGANYSKNSKHKQGEAFYKMRYGFWLTLIASGKLAYHKKSFSFFINCINGFFKAKNDKLPFIVSAEEGVFIRNLRWKGIKQKLF